MSAAAGMADLTEDEKETAANAIEEEMPRALAQIAHPASDFDVADDLVNAIFIGACPECDSRDVGSFEEVAGIEDPTVGRCFACGCLWCAECGQPLSRPEEKCGHWAICEACGEDEECEFMGDITECLEIENWLARKHADGGAKENAR